MAARRNIPISDAQLDLFSTQRSTNDTADTIRPDGRETLARTPPEDGARTGTNGTPAPDASGGGGKDEGRNGHATNGIDAAGINGAASPDAGLGNGEGEIHPPAAGAGEVVPLNAGNYRITDTDRIGEGGLKQKYRQNLAAIRAVRQIQAEVRPATTEEKAVIAKYVGWGDCQRRYWTHRSGRRTKWKP